MVRPMQQTAMSQIFSLEEIIQQEKTGQPGNSQVRQTICAVEKLWESP